MGFPHMPSADINLRDEHSWSHAMQEETLCLTSAVRMLCGESHDVLLPVTERGTTAPG